MWNTWFELGEIFVTIKGYGKLLESLPNKWEPTVMAIEEPKKIKTIIPQELLGSLFTHEPTLERVWKEKEVVWKKKRNLAL